MNIVERWYCPVKDVDVKIFKQDWHYEEHIMSRGEKIVHYHLEITSCVPYKFHWDTLNKISHDHDKYSLVHPPVYMELDNNPTERVFVEERQFRDTDYVVMGKIGKENWIKELWAKLVEVKQRSYIQV